MGESHQDDDGPGRVLNPREELGAAFDNLAPYVERMIAVVQQARGVVVEIGVEFGAPEVRFRLPLGSAAEVYRRVRSELTAIQNEVP